MSVGKRRAFIRALGEEKKEDEGRMVTTAIKASHSLPNDFMVEDNSIATEGSPFQEASRQALWYDNTTERRPFLPRDMNGEGLRGAYTVAIFCDDGSILFLPLGILKHI